MRTRGSCSPGESIARARASDLNACVTILDDPTASWPQGPLGGVPFAVKDNICLGRTTCGSRLLADYVSPFEATCVARLRAAGGVPIAKTNLDEFAMGSSTERSCFGPTRNPHDPTRSPGGSSGGSAAAVAQGIVPFALGSDTGGSVRQPAAFCGVVGFKPSYGRVSRWGLVAYASSLDQVGVLATSVEDAALVYQVIAGHDPLDATCSRRVVDRLRVDRPVENLVVGVPTIPRGSHPAVGRAVEQAARDFARLGARVVPVDLPNRDHAIAAYYVIAAAEASSNLARFDGMRYGARAEGTSLDEVYRRSRTQGLGEEVQRRVMLGTFVLSSGYAEKYYATALRARRLIAGDYERVFDAGCHVLLTPTTPTPAFRLGEKLEDPLALYLEDVHTVGVNLAGLPAIALPAGTTRVDGRDLPVSVQLIGPAWGEDVLLRAAWMLEQNSQISP